LVLSSSFNELQLECRVLFLFSYIFWSLLCALRYDQFWRKFHGLLRTMYIVWKLDEIFAGHQLGPFDSWWWFSSRISLLIFCFDDLSIGDGGVLKSPTTTVLESIYAFRSFRVCFMKLGALTLGAYRLIIVISFWYISPFISMKYPPLSHLINVWSLLCPRKVLVILPVLGGHWLGKFSYSLSP
jgi:hypothetical protein